jgi:hypothetical protein
MKKRCTRKQEEKNNLDIGLQARLAPERESHWQRESGLTRSRAASRLRLLLTVKQWTSGLAC